MGNEVLKEEAHTWAEFRFTVIGQLLSSPPEKGFRKKAFQDLAERVWQHPISGGRFKLSWKTIERWYYRAIKKGSRPLESLVKKVRRDKSVHKISLEVAEKIQQLYKAHSNWSCQLILDNLRIVHEGKIPSYSTLGRYLKANGMSKQPIHRFSPGAAHSADIRSRQECRSFENPFTNGLWHLDFHHCSREILTKDGRLVRPCVLAIMDDHSRLICHLQWYLDETAESLVHGFCQAIAKRGLPRSLMSDNGAAMISKEFTEGLARLSITHDTTLPYSPNQNGKQEVFWSQLEGRLMKLIENKQAITLVELNQYSFVWVEEEYQRKLHDGINTTPLDRFINDKNIGLQAPTMQEMINAFRRDESRKLRRSDCSISLESIRYEIPYVYRHLRKIMIRYATWDLSNVHIVNEMGKELMPIFPVDKAANSSSGRKSCNPVNSSIEQAPEPVSDEIAPLMKKYIQNFEERGLIPAYLPTEEKNT